MKKNYIVLLLAILFSGIVISQETQKNFINYQGVARNADNELMVSEQMTINIALKFGTANAASVYEESHTLMTDANGVFSLLIGNGSSLMGEYNSLPWGSAATFLTVSMNGNEIGTTEMMAVPYAISSGDADDQNAEEVTYDNSTSGLTATTTQAAIDELSTGGTLDADADPSNELQTLNFDAVTNELSLSDGNSVTIPSGGTDADADPSNELQTLNFDAGTNELSLSDGNSVRIPSGGTDADADPTNEIQTISFDAVSNKISLTDGGEITIPSGGTDADADPTNEIQTISFDAASNKISLTDGGEIMIPSGGTDADADPTNEIQDISLVGTELSISGGSTIDLEPIIPSGGTDNQELNFNETTKILEIEDGNTVDLGSLAGGSGGSSSGLEAIDEGNGIGWRLLGRDPANYGNIGENAIDFSYGQPDVNKGATGESSFSIGFDNRSIGASSITMGTRNSASGSFSTAIGKFNIAAEEHCIALGQGNTASEKFSFAIGHNNSASKQYSRAIGNNNSASGEGSTAIGHRTSADSYLSTAMGTLNIGGGDPNDWLSYNPLFEIGNGQGNTRHNALTILKDGNTGIGIAVPKATLDIIGGKWDLNNSSGDLHIGNDDFGLRIGVALGAGLGQGNVHIRAKGGSNTLKLGGGINDVLVITEQDVLVSGVLVHTSDQRLKKEIRTLPYGLDEVLRLRPKAYYWKKDSDNSRLSLGLIAQEVEPIIKEIVHNNINSDDTLSVSYTELIPVLIKAIQEQQDIIDQQAKKITDQEEKFQDQEARLQKLEAGLLAKNQP